jgi:pectate lyase
MKHSQLVMSLAAAMTLTACGGSGGGGSKPSTNPSLSSSSLASSLSSVSTSAEVSSSAPNNSEASSSEARSSAISSSVISSSTATNSSSSAGVDFTSCDYFNQPQGFAAAGQGTTGGADTGLGNNTVTVSTGAELNSVLNASNATYKDKPLVVYIDGIITWENSGNTEIRLRRSNVSIIGLENSAEFSGVGIRISHGASNIIIRNLVMHEVPQARGAGDHINLDGRDGAVTNIWIDHNEFYNDLTVDKDYYDELVSGRGAIHNVTISYNLLHDSQKTSLWGSSDNAVEEDVGRSISFHHNHWDNVVSRLPLFRFGEGHIWNNYYSNVSGSAINSRMGATLRIDNNVFENVKNPIFSADSSSIGFWNATGNSFTGVSWGSTPVANCTTPPCYAGAQDAATTQYEPPYTYSSLATAEVKNHVLAYAGPNKILSCLNLPSAGTAE